MSRRVPSPCPVEAEKRRWVERLASTRSAHLNAFESFLVISSRSLVGEIIAFLGFCRTLTRFDSCVTTRRPTTNERQPNYWPASFVFQFTVGRTNRCGGCIALMNKCGSYSMACISNAPKTKLCYRSLASVCVFTLVYTYPCFVSPKFQMS